MGRSTRIFGPGHVKMCLMPYANNKGTDQPAHLRSLISTFIVRCLDSILPLVPISKISRLKLASVAAQAGLNLTWSKFPEDRFSLDVAHLKMETEEEDAAFCFMHIMHCDFERTVTYQTVPRQANLCLRAFRHDKF